jgi:hypothetical protein
MSWWKRVEELEETAREEGFTLSMPAEQILRIEDEGSMVDLRTGQIIDLVEEGEAPAEKSSWWPFG